MYFFEGDYDGRSYMQFVASVDIVTRLQNLGNADAGWRIDHTEEGYGGIQPKRPDYCGHPFDEKRHCIWHFPGEMQSRSDPAERVPGETGSRSSDPHFKSLDVMRFFPSYAHPFKWEETLAGRGAYGSETWMTVRDKLNDRCIRLGWTGFQQMADVYDCRTNAWVYSQWSNEGGTSFKDYLAADHKRRRFYSICAGNGHLYSTSMDSLLSTDMGPVPAGNNHGIINRLTPVFDEYNDVLLNFNWYAFPDGAPNLSSWNPDTNTWTVISYSVDGATRTGPPCLRVAAVFQEYGVLMGYGGTAEHEGYVPTTMELFRYSAGSRVAPPVPDPTASPDGTRGSTVKDDYGRVWTFGAIVSGANRRILKDGVDTGGYAVEFKKYGFWTYVRNEANDWFVWAYGGGFEQCYIGEPPGP